MQRQELMKEYNRLKRLKGECDTVQMGLEDSFTRGTYIYKGINIFVSKILFDEGIVFIHSCDETDTFHNNTEPSTCIEIKEFISKCL